MMKPNELFALVWFVVFNAGWIMRGIWEVHKRRETDALKEDADVQPTS